jgi:hypothetical protein
MANLPTAAIVLIVTGLACFDTPAQVATCVKEKFGIDISRQRIESYHPERHAGSRLSPHWRELFYETRQRYMTELENIGIVWPAFRLRRLQRMLEQAEEMGNYVLVAQILQQAAREVGRL